jgi:uncharacterized membrane protein
MMLQFAGRTVYITIGQMSVCVSNEPHYFSKKLPLDYFAGLCLGPIPIVFALSAPDWRDEKWPFRLFPLHS